MQLESQTLDPSNLQPTCFDLVTFLGKPLFLGQLRPHSSPAFESQVKWQLSVGVVSQTIPNYSVDQYFG